MTGIEKITDRILGDAQAEVDATLSEAKAQADSITAKYAAQAEREYKELTAKGAAAAAERESHLNSSAQMEAKKLMLFAKQEMLDKAFQEALRQLNGLPDNQMTDLLAKLAQRASSTGTEQVILSGAVRDRLGQAVVAKANAEGNLHLTLSQQSGAFQGGLLLSEGDVEVNCTFDTLVRLTRGEISAQVAQALFN